MRKLVQAGFTLIELVVVIVILGILAAIAVPQFVDLAGDAKIAVADGACGALQSSAVLLYASKKGSSTIGEIQTNVNTSPGIAFAGTCAAPTATYTPPSGGAASPARPCGAMPAALCT
jgi:MSHA pilin protein MshA